MVSQKAYVTTTIPYVNSSPHLGFALELVQADSYVRALRNWQNKEVFFNTGTDEHGSKIYQKAIELSLDPKQLCDQMASKFVNLIQNLNVSSTAFIRTTDIQHKYSAQNFWKKCMANGDIYKGTYKTKYCVGCELEKTESELENGKCPLHPNINIEEIEEENYFFKFSNYQGKLLDLYKQEPNLVIPSSKMNEIVSFVESGLQDFSISRLKSKMPWGIEVPEDPDHVMYVWFDALVNYISTLGWPDNQENFKQYWLDTDQKPQAIQFAGKDNLRQQSAMWQAMLLSAGVPHTAQIFIHGFITSNGQKMSKSLGNVIDPFELINEFSADALRYYLLAELSPIADGDFTREKFISRYNSDLANGLGNLISRINRLASRVPNITPSNQKPSDELIDLTLNYKFNEAMQYIWQNQISVLDKYINDKEPWKLSTEDLGPIMQEAVNQLWDISISLSPFLPSTSAYIQQTSIAHTPMDTPLFPRKIK